MYEINPDDLVDITTMEACPDLSPPKIRSTVAGKIHSFKNHLYNIGKLDEIRFNQEFEKFFGMKHRVNNMPNKEYNKLRREVYVSLAVDRRFYIKSNFDLCNPPLGKKRKMTINRVTILRSQWGFKRRKI